MMNGRTGYVYDLISAQHTQAGHPECAERLAEILDELETSGLLADLRRIDSRAATMEELLRAHTPEHVAHVQALSESGGGMADEDTYLTPASYQAARVAAGSLIDLTLAVIDGTVDNGFAFVRPPGHHATRSAAMGFCLFNNVALAAKAAQQERGLTRIAIIDFDAHHGNGTQEIFEGDPTVLYASTHQFPFYPGTGALREIEDGDITLNVPLPANVGDIGFLQLYYDVFPPVIRRFQPQIMLISAGYDCHWNDPFARLGLSQSGLARLSATLVALAQELCGGKIVFALEGGYDMRTLRHGAANSVRALLGRNDFTDSYGQSPRIEPDLCLLIRELKRIHGLA